MTTHGVSFVSLIYVPNTKSVAHFLVVDFGEGCCCYLVSCDGGETKSTPSPTVLDCTVRLDWSLTKRTRTAIIKIYQTQIDGRGSSMDNAILLKMIFDGRDPLMKDKLCTLPLIKQWQQNP